MAQIDFNKIVTNAVSAVVTMIVIGACTVLWKAATTVDDKVNAATSGLKIVVEEVQTKLVDLQSQNNDLVSAINELKKEVEKNHKPGTQPPDFSRLKSMRPRELPDQNFIEQKMIPPEHRSKK
jgi:hypothetical protein